MTNYQYRYGGTAIDVVRALYAEGGPRRFYRGHCDPLSLSFFCDQNCTELLVSSHVHAWLCKSCPEFPILHRYVTHLRHSASPIAICNTTIRLLDLQSAIADALHNLTCPCGMHHHENERQEILPLFINIIITLIVSSSRQEVVEGKDAVEEIRD